MKLIKQFNINTENLSAVSQSRSYTISGDIGAVFNIRITTPTKFYDFKSKSFVSSETSDCMLSNVTLDTSSFTSNIVFPADADGEVYTIELIALSHFDTKIDEGLVGTDADGNDLKYNNSRIVKSITQVADVVITFSSIAATTGNYSGTTHTQTVTATQSPLVPTSLTKSFDWTFLNVASDARGFGFIAVQDVRRDSGLSLNKVVDVLDSTWYTTTTVTITDTKSDDGGGSSHYDYIVESNDSVSVGGTVTGVSAGSLSGNPTISRVYIGGQGDRSKIGNANYNKPSLKFSSAQVFSEGTVLTIKVYGFAAIKKATNIDLKTESMILTQNALSTTVRADSASDTEIEVNGTYGISKGAFIDGFGIDNSSNNPITSISASSSAGAITVTLAQTLAQGSVLNISGSSNSYTVKGDLTINSFPTSNATIYFDLDKILTLGTQS
jgi:hypothetical protein